MIEEGGSEMGAKERKGTSKSGWGTEQSRQEAEEKKKDNRKGCRSILDGRKHRSKCVREKQRGRNKG